MTLEEFVRVLLPTVALDRTKTLSDGKVDLSVTKTGVRESDGASIYRLAVIDRTKKGD